MTGKAERPLGYGQLGGDSRVNVQADGVHVSDLAGTDRVHIGQLADGEYGLRVVSSDGSTVIIDGTSDMFRIAATGTITIPAGPNAGQVAVTVDVATGFTYPPAVVGYAEFAAFSSIGMPYLRLGSGAAIDDVHWIGCAVQAGNQTRVQVLWGSNVNRTGESMDYRYYILEQVGI